MKTRFTLVLILCLADLSLAATKYVKANSQCGGLGITADPCLVNASTSFSATSSAGTDNAGAPAAGDIVIADAGSGNLSINSATNSWESFNQTGYLGALSGSSTLNIKGLAGSTTSTVLAGTFNYTGSLTFVSSATAVINLTTNGKLLTRISIQGSAGGKVVLQDGLSFVATKTPSIVITNSGALDLNAQTISGNSAINRVLITSDVTATARTVVVNAGHFAYASFRDINFNNGGADLDLAAITGLSGDCKGNGMVGGGALTFTTPTTQTWSGSSGGSWSTNAWTTHVPLCQDTAVIGAMGTSQTITADMPRLGKDIDFSGATWTTALTLNCNTATSVFGSVTLKSGMSSAGSSAWTFETRSSSTLTSAGFTWPQALTFNMASGTMTLQDALQTSSSITHTLGTLNTNGKAVQTGTGAVGLTVANDAGTTLTLGASTVTLPGTGTVWSVAGSSPTISASSSTIVVSNTTGTAKTFAGGGKTYGTLTFSGDAITVTGSNTIGTLNVNNASNRSNGGLKLTAGTTQTITTYATDGSSGTHSFLQSSTTSAATIALASGTACMGYTDLTWITGSPAATWSSNGNLSNQSQIGTCGASGPLMQILNQ